MLQAGERMPGRIEDLYSAEARAMLQIVHLCIASLPNLERYGIPDEPELDRRRYEVKTLDLRSITELVAEIKTYCLPCERVVLL